MTHDTDTESTDHRSNARDRTDGGKPVTGATGTANAAVGDPLSGLDAAVARFAATCEAHAYRWVQASFAFVFFYFGLQKWPVIQGASPVRPPVRAFVEAVGFGGWVPLAPEVGLLFIGVYEVSLGLLWLGTLLEERHLGTSRVFLAAAVGTIAHQTVTFLPLLLVPGVAFRSTQFWVPLAGTVPFPVALDWLSAFILKNLLFFGAFFYAFAEWADRYRPDTTAAEG